MARKRIRRRSIDTSTMSFPPPANSDDSFTQLTSTAMHISTIKGHLDSLVDALQDQPSLLGRLANAWGKQSLWKKALGGVLLFGGLITIGVLAQVTLLVVVSSIFAAGFIVGGMLLDNHYKKTQQEQARFHQGIQSLASALVVIITALENIRIQLTAEVGKFKRENQKLSENIEGLGIEIIRFTTQVDDLSTTREALSGTEEKLAHITTQHETLQADFLLKVAELEEVKKSMGLEITKLKAVGATLECLVGTLSEAVLEEETFRKEFKIKLEGFLTNGTASFDKIADRICQAERELEVVKVALDLSNRQYASLLERHAEQVKKFEKVTMYVALASQSGPMLSGKPTFFGASEKTIKNTSQDDSQITYHKRASLLA